MRPIRLAALFVGLIGWLAPRACAQFIGYTSPQTVQQTIASNVNCTGAAQTYAISNLGQTQHYLNIITGTQPTKFQAVINGVDNAGNVFRISDVMENAFTNIIAQGQGSIYGSGYFPKVQVVITCGPAAANYTATYSGGWGTSNVDAGTYLAAQIDKVNFNGAAGGVNQSDTFQTPFGSSAGTIYAQYNGAVAGGSVAVLCDTNQFVSTLATFNLANANTLQTFTVTDSSCPYLTVNYTSGGAATAITVEYVFSMPGLAHAATTGGTGTSVTQGTTPWVDNITQFGGNNVVTGTGASGAGIPRVTVANDSNVSMNLSQVNGSTVATGGLTGGQAVIAVQAPGGQSNSESTSGTNAAVSKTIAAVGGQRVHLYSAGVRCSAGNGNLTIADGGTQIWSSDANFAGASTKTASWPIPLASTSGNAMTITLGACGTGNTGTLDVQVSQF